MPPRNDSKRYRMLQEENVFFPREDPWLGATVGASGGPGEEGLVMPPYVMFDKYSNTCY